MVINTAAPYSVPYLQDTDELYAVPAWAQSLALRVSALLPMRGTVTIPVTNSATGAGAVAFPNGGFPQGTVPLVFVQQQGSLVWEAVSPTNVSATGFTCNVRTISGAAGTGNIPVAWQALRNV